MRLSWRSRVRAGDEVDEEKPWSPPGDAKPDFLCIGAKKAGTSWLYHQLRFHPDFWMPPVKELHYFDALGRTKRRNPPRCRDDRDRRFLERLTSLGAGPHFDLKSYSLLFEAKGTLLCGDITPAYSRLKDEIIQNVIDYFPTLRVIFLARDPVERAWSQLSMAVRLGTISPFDATDAGRVIRNLLTPGVLLCSYPSETVARWRRYVQPDFFRVYFFDDLERNPSELRCSILHFLGADPEKPSGGEKADYNNDAKKEKLRLTEKVRFRMAQFFRDELKACAAQLGGPAREWPARYGFSVLYLFTSLSDDFDLFVWCEWLA